MAMHRSVVPVKLFQYMEATDEIKENFVHPKTIVRDVEQLVPLKLKAESDLVGLYKNKRVEEIKDNELALRIGRSSSRIRKD